MNIKDIKNYIINEQILEKDLIEIKMIIDKKTQKNLKDEKIEKSFKPSYDKCPTCGKIK